MTKELFLRLIVAAADFRERVIQIDRYPKAVFLRRGKSETPDRVNCSTIAPDDPPGVVLMKANAEKMTPVFRLVRNTARPGMGNQPRDNVVEVFSDGEDRIHDCP